MKKKIIWILAMIIIIAQPIKLCAMDDDEESEERMRRDHEGWKKRFVEGLDSWKFGDLRPFVDYGFLSNEQLEENIDQFLKLIGAKKDNWKKIKPTVELAITLKYPLKNSITQLFRGLFTTYRLPIARVIEELAKKSNKKLISAFEQFTGIKDINKFAQAEVQRRNRFLSQVGLKKSDWKERPPALLAGADSMMRTSKGISHFFTDVPRYLRPDQAMRKLVAKLADPKNQKLITAFEEYTGFKNIQQSAAEAVERAKEFDARRAPIPAPPPPKPYWMN